ncbi:hypothetical protein SAMN05444008_1309 [Cnuella takakiae]|uniref:Uncharacterized protein n=1 Tax=Cnuella takakiae TaxID=1302690 RepID=A0A1M5JB15_9BACT|nr:hypothetical protein [Cnuella takakiae]OLY95599.1 hypothetical protein BUE76_00425 [Cnuella takakiae]SHG37758.1 hypothetical protein SAMN05444008_1309 [Cnuella takakiae]
MAKKFPPKNEDMIGDPSRTEGAPAQIVGGGRGGTFKQPSEAFTEMHERRGGNPNVKQKNESFQDLIARQKKEQKPPDDTNPTSPASAATKPESKNESPSIRAIQQQLKELDKQKDNPSKEPEVKKEKKPEKDISHGI